MSRARIEHLLLGTKWFWNRLVAVVGSDRLSLTFGALADPTRRAILERLLQGEATVAELAEPFDLTARAVSKHVAVLERAGLVSRGRDAQRRPTRIQLEPLVHLDTWLRLYRRVWTQRFDQLDSRLQRLQRRKPK